MSINFDMSQFTYYEILGIPEDASDADIKSAYRTAILKYHPDVFKGDPKEAEEITQWVIKAYQTLSDSQARAEYDLTLGRRTRAQENTQESMFVKIHTLDYELGYYVVEKIVSDLSPQVQSCIVDNQLYACTNYMHSRSNQLIISKDDFYDMLHFYQSDSYNCIIYNADIRKVRSARLSRSQFTNNPLQYLSPNSNLLYVEESQGQFTAISPEVFNAAKQAVEDKRYLLKLLFKGIGVVCLIILFIFGVFSYDDDTPSSSANSNYSSLPPVTAPAHNTVMAFSDMEANFFIETQFSEHTKYYFIKIQDFNSGETVQTVFIHAGINAEVYVPNGTYTVKWVSGDTWYGYGAYFGNRSAQRADDLFLFDDFTGWTVTLYPVADGNMDTDNIDMSDF